VTGDVFRAGPTLRVGVVGCGRVGGAICRSLDEHVTQARLHAIYDVNAANVQAVMWSLKHRPQSMSLAGVIATCDLIVEATNPKVAPDVIRHALDGGKDVLVTNAVAIVGREEFVGIALERGTSIRLACDVLVGLDGVRAAVGGAIESAALTVVGPPAFFASQPAGQRAGLDAVVLDQPKQCFRGTGADALEALPELANAIAVLCFAGRGFGQTTVIAVADPATRDLTCRIAASAAEVSLTTESRIPLPEQGPRASPLVALSAVTALRRAVDSLVVG